MNNVPVALKIMPIMSESDISKNEKEIKIVKLLSQRVLDNKSTHFPIVYLDYRCNTIELKKSSKFYKKSMMFSIMNKVAFILNKPIMELMYNYDKPTDIESSLQIANQILKDHHKSTILRLDDIFSMCDIIVSELANMDMIAFTKEHVLHSQSLDDTVFLDIINSIISGIIDMQEERLIHNDLHLGNILVLKRDGVYIYLIHDFGVSIIQDDTSDTWTNEEQLLDIDRFISNIDEYNIDEYNKKLLSAKMNTFFKELKTYIRDLLSSHNIPNCMELLQQWVKKYQLGGKRHIKQTYKFKKIKKNKHTLRNRK